MRTVFAMSADERYDNKMHYVELPRYADTVVIGAGAAVAGILAECSQQTVVLLEAGPDYGPLESGQWPAELLDARTIPCP